VDKHKEAPQNRPKGLKRAIHVKHLGFK